MRFSLIYALVLTILCLQLTDGQKPTPKPKKAGPPGGPIKKRSFSDGEDKGILMTMFDGSVSFLENLRRQYKFGFSKDDRRRVSRVWFAITADIGTNTRVKRGADETEMKTNVDTAMDTDPDDKTLQVVGDGSVYMMVWKNKSYDGGRSYELIAEYQRHEETKMKNDFETPYKPEKTETKPSKPDPQPDDQSSDDTKSDDKPKPSPTTESKPESTTEEDFAPDPHELVNTTPPPIVDYPTDRDKNYPSNKDGTYGFVVQLTYGPNPELIRLRGKEMYYFNKVGNNIVFTNDMMPVKNNRMKLPPDITSAFRGPDNMYYFIREDAYCRRPRDVSGIGLDPPDYCPEGGDVRELLGCNLRFYPPEVDDLCNNPVLDHAVLSPDNKTAWLFRGKDIWHLHNLPTNPKASPSKCNVTKHSSDVTKIWQKFDTKGDALFLLESPDKNRHDLVLLHRHKYTIWDFNGGAPKVEGFIKEQPITAYGNNKGTKKQMFTEKPIVAPVEDDKRDEKSIVYQEEPFRKLCMDPTIDSADSSLDGTEIYLFKGDNYYLLTGLKGKGIGKLTKFERSDKLLPNFKPKSAAVMTCKEGQTRGYAYEYFSKTAGKKTTTMSKSWEIDKNVDKPEDEFIEYTAAGFTAAFHNRNVTDPQMIVLRNDDVFYYSTVGDIFTRKRRHVKHYESAEKLPPGVTAAFSMPDQMLYLFQGNHYCYRELFYNKKPLFCPEWRDSRDLFGCFGPDVKRGKTPSQGNKHDKKALADLCSDLNIGDLDRSWQREDTVYVWRGKKFWKIADFPRAPRVVQSGNTNTEWDGFSDDPDAVAIIQEGKMRRGWMLSFYGGYWSGWYPDQRPWISYKAWWGQPTGTMKFGATMHNGDIKNPMVLGFDGSQVHTYASTGTLLDLRNTKRVDETEENWPKDVTAAMRMADNTVYLFRGEKYCKRSWKCKDGDCCKEWKNAMNLFHCPGTKESESRNYKDNKNGDQNDGEEETELQKPKAKPTEEPPPEPITEEPIKKPNIKQSKKTTDPPNDDEDYVVKKDSKKSRKNGPRPDQIRPTPRRRH